MFKKITLSILLSALSFSCIASSPQAWEEFRATVKEKCEAEIKKEFEINSIIIDPEGSQSYGIAIATGEPKGEGIIASQVCIFNKVSEKVELGTWLPIASNDSIDINEGENPLLNNCLDKAVTSLDMNDCRSKYGNSDNSDNSIDIHTGENPQLDSCLDKAMTSLAMNDCRSKYGNNNKGR